MTLFMSSKYQLALNIRRRLFQCFMLGLCWISLSACKTVNTMPDDEQHMNDALIANVEMRPWMKKPLGIAQLFATEESSSASTIVELSHYFNRLHQLSTEALKGEISVVENAYKAEPLPVVSLSLAYLYTVKLSLNNTKKAEKILVGLIKNTAVHESYRAFAQLLLHSMAGEAAQRRLWIKERRKNKTLNQQLDALKDIELKINDRQPTTESVEPSL